MKILSLPNIVFSLLFCLAFSNSVQAYPNPLWSLDGTDSRSRDTGISHNIGNPDSIGTVLGHCMAIIVADTNCQTHTIQLSAFVYFTFSGVFAPVEVNWSTGEVAHTITVVPPGIWSWDPTFSGCEVVHWFNFYDQPASFFSGDLEILGPSAICPTGIADLTVQSGGYNFSAYAWSPANPNGGLSPFTISAPGTYNLSVTDHLGCQFLDAITVVPASSSLSVEADDQSLCIGETATITPVVSGGLPGYNYLWSTGETTASISSTTSGTYTLKVVDGCGVLDSVSVDLAFEACGCASETFIKTIGEVGQDVRGYGVYDSKDGNLYITGLKQDSAVIIKMTPVGSVLWMRTFDVKVGVNDRISELIVDSEGMLVGCGLSGESQVSTGFVFRYNPTTNVMQWINTYGLEFPRVYGLMELPNGNYLVYDYTQIIFDARILEITRLDGTIDLTSSLSQKLRLGNQNIFNIFTSATILDGKLYVVGRFTTDNGFIVNERHTLARIDIGTGNVDWSRLSHIAPSQIAHLEGADLLLENDHIISAGFGSEVNNDVSNYQVFLQKNTLDGDLLWVKRFNIPESVGEYVEELVSVPDGFIIFVQDNSVQGNLYLLKTDKNGNFQWAKKVDYGPSNFANILSHFQSQILAKDNHLYFVSSTQTPGTNFNALVVKTTLDGNLVGNCDFIHPVLVESSDVTNPTNLEVVLQKIPFDEEAIPIILTPTGINLLMENHCKVFINEQVDISLCPGKSVIINGAAYTQDTTFSIEIPGAGGCDTLRTYAIEALPYPIRSESISFCPGSSVTIGGQVYDQAGTVIDTVSAISGCDTIVTYTLSIAPYQTRSENIAFCSDSSVTIGGQVYNQSGIVTDTLPSANACDTIVTYALTLLPYQTRSESRSFCPGSSVMIGGQVYHHSGTVIDTLPSIIGCDTIVTYTLTLLPNPTRSQTISFCPGETITLDGTNYTQPGTVVLTLPAATSGCDTIASYTLQFLTPATSNVSIACPNAITINQPSGGGAVANYNLPTTASDCPCPGIALALTSGMPSGSNFPMGVTSVCYTAKDSCGHTAACCFNVAVVQDDDACDTKLNGCIKYELLTITEDMAKNRTYRIRVTNNCTNKLLYTAIQVPDGVVAISPLNFSTYVAPSGNTYGVRNPNFSPQYSIRYSSISDSINLGESDIFKYTLPAQANVTFIHIVSRLAPYIYLEAHLNTFYCPIGVTPGNDRPGAEREDLSHQGELLLFPNPASQLVRAVTGGQPGELILQDVMGRVMLRKSVDKDGAEFSVEGLPQGLYQVVFIGEKTMLYRSLVVQR